MTRDQIFVKMAVDGWDGQVTATSKLFDQLTDEQLMEEVAPGKNRGIYLLGHLVSVHDKMLSLLLLAMSYILNYIRFLCNRRIGQ